MLHLGSGGKQQGFNGLVRGDAVVTLDVFCTHSILQLSLFWAVIWINPLLQATARTLGTREVQFW